MRLSKELSKYLATQYFNGIALVAVVLLVVMFTGDLVEYLRRMSGREDAALGIALKLAFLHIPFMIQQTLPYSVLLGSLISVQKLVKSQELIAARAMGLSLSQIVLPSVLIAIAIGIVLIVLFNSLVSATQTRIQKIEAEYLGGYTGTLTVAGSNNFWLRQSTLQQESIIHARQVNAKRMTLHDVTVYHFNKKNQLTHRIDSEKAELEEKRWVLSNSLITDSEGVVEEIEVLYFGTNLTQGQIQEGFSSPESMSIWSIGPFIKMLKKAGFSAKRHRLHLHSMLALPFLLAGMSIIGSCFATKPLTLKAGNYRFVLGLGIGFLLFYFVSILEALGLSGKIAVELAAWTPPAISLLIGGSMILHAEDS